MTFFVQVLRPGEKTRPVRQTASLLVAPFEGKGHSIIDGKRFDWKKFDNLAVPGGNWFEHVNGGHTTGDPVRRQRRAGLEMFPPVQEMGSRRCRRHRASSLIPAAQRRARKLARGRLRARVPGRGWSVPSSHNTTLISHVDCPGGGQVWVDGTTLYVAHMSAPHGTSIYDVADPRHPRLLARIDMPQGWHSHKVRVANGVMIVNHEQLGQDGDRPSSAAGSASTTSHGRASRS